MALGASPGSILRLVVVSALRVTSVGLLLGLLASLAVVRFIASLLFGVQPLDPSTFAAAAAALTVVALAACVAPALRAVRSNPADSLRA